MAIDQTQPLAVRQTGGGGLGNAAWQNAASVRFENSQSMVVRHCSRGSGEAAAVFKSYR